MPFDVILAVAAVEAQDAHRQQRIRQPPRYITRQEVVDELMRSVDISHAQVGTPAVKGILMPA